MSTLNHPASALRPCTDLPASEDHGEGLPIDTPTDPPARHRRVWISLEALGRWVFLGSVFSNLLAELIADEVKLALEAVYTVIVALL